MKIYTRNGDLGRTYLLGGENVPKNHNRLIVIGTIDELNSFLGWINDDFKVHNQFEENYKTILNIQHYLFSIGSILATTNPDALKIKLPNNEAIHTLEQKIDEMDSQLPTLKNFILPGGHPLVSKCHIARSICRRAERELCGLSPEIELPSTIFPYINRLSDFLFILARYVGHDLGVEEIKWKPD